MLRFPILITQISSKFNPHVNFNFNYRSMIPYEFIYAYLFFGKSMNC